MTIVEVLTRTMPERAEMLERNKASLAQMPGDYIQTTLEDTAGVGVGDSFRFLHAAADWLIGDYIWILDDDDICTHDTLFVEVADIVKRHDPDVIFVRFNHGRLGVKPEYGHWENVPQHCHIGVSSYIVRKRVWQKHAAAFLSCRYASDYDFIKAVWDSKPSVYWHDVIAGEIGE